jgi:hypothetical protein
MSIAKYNVPAIIQQWIEALASPSNPAHIRENYAFMLDNVRDACEKELVRYRGMKAQTAPKARKQSKNLS